MSVLKVEKLEGGVGLLTLNKPQRMNAWSADLAALFFEALNDWEDDPSVRVVVVTGEGRAFCAGADAQGRFDKETPEQKKARLERQEKMKTWRIRRLADISKMRLPVIACINGGCVGIGLSLALACDMRFAAKDAKIGVIFPQRGLIAEEGMGYILPHLVGTGNALMMLLSGDVEKAEDLPQGMLQRTFPKETLLKETLAFATKLAQNSSPTSMAVMKQQTYTMPRLTISEATAINDRIQESSLREANPDHEEGFAAFTGKRSPNFKPYDASLPFAKVAKELLQSKL